MNNIVIPPIRCQGIKSKLVNDIKFIVSSISYERWIEPFMGSGVVGFNIRPDKAIFADINPYLIQFYTDIKTNKITPDIVKDYLSEEGDKLLKTGGEHYYVVRERFNKEHNSLDFLFINHSCFNKVIRFNSKGSFNSPFCRIANKFSKSYITRIVNQISNIQEIIRNKEYTFKCQSFEQTIKEANKEDLIYCDPPYLGRHVMYFNSWNEEQELLLHNMLISSGIKFILSTWHSDKYRYNKYIDTIWKDLHIITKEHFYIVGGKKERKHLVLEALISNFNAQLPESRSNEIYQGSIFNDNTTSR